MDYLLDTHTFLWFLSDDGQLSHKATDAITNPNAAKYVSLASLWEIAIKLNIGKLELDIPYSTLINHMDINGFELLNIGFEHTNTLATLKLHHRDPFDRIIIAQAINEKLTIISKDKNFAMYQQLKLLW